MTFPVQPSFEEASLRALQEVDACNFRSLIQSELVELMYVAVNIARKCIYILPPRFVVECRTRVRSLITGSQELTISSFPLFLKSVILACVDGID
jgi:hypothetical protein